MDAVVVKTFGGPEAMKVENIPIPEISSPGQVLVKIYAAGINPVDTYIRAGTYARLPSLPYTPGREGAGVIERVSEDVTTVKPGQRVYITASLTGTYAQFALCPANSVRPIPDHISFVEGAAVSIAYRTAYRALFQLASSHGLNVIGTASTSEGRETILKYGATQVFDHKCPTYIDQILSASAETGIHIIIEMLANVNLSNDLKMISRRGTIVVVGNRGETSINARLLMQKESTLTGVLAGTDEEHEAAYCAIDAGLKHKYLHPHVGSMYGLSEAPSAHEEVIAHRQGTLGKLVLQPWGSQP
eukprot:gene887-4152_t